MARYVFDLETNGLLPSVSVIHSCVLKDVDTGEVFSFGPIKDNFPCLELLCKADELIGHNIVAFDIPVMKKVWGLTLDTSRVKLTDTLTLARLAFSDISDSDQVLVARKKMPPKLIGRHSLEAWGHRLGLHKGDYTGGWESWSPEMQAYCERDIEVTTLLYKRVTEGGSEQSRTLEHQAAAVCTQIETNGFYFDEKGAVALWQTLEARRDELASKMQELFPPWESFVVEAGVSEWIAKSNNKKLGRVKGEPYRKIKLNTFNPLSRDHIANRLGDKYGWKPAEFTDGGKPKVDETVLEGLDYPEAKQLAELFLVEKRISSISTGTQAWLKQVGPDKRIHGRYNSNGAVTGRATHSNPNIAQVPKVGKPYGAECRELFKASPGYKLLGADLQGLELRCLAHYMSRWDDGLYAELVVKGDPHTANMKAAGLDKLISDPKLARDKAKTFIYAFLYGAGDAKIGSIVGQGSAKGKQLKAEFLKKTPALASLTAAVKTKASTTGTLKGLDGRVLKVRSQHAALNTLLQSAGAILCKAWMIRTDTKLRELGLVHGVGKDYAITAWVHDELQIEIKEGLEDVVGRTVTEAAIEAGRELGFIPPLEAAWKAGASWAGTH